MGRHSRQGWLARLVKRLLSWLCSGWRRFRGQRRTSSAFPRASVPETHEPPPPPQTQVEQSLTGDRNVGIGVVEAGAQVTVTYGAAPLPTGELNPFGVPYPRNKFFTGRREVLKQLHQQLNHETTAAITQVQAISGLGGIGKTQTAVEYAYCYHYDERVYDTVLWVKAETEVALATDFANLARQLALPVAQSTQEEQIPAVRAWLARQNGWLLIFDNADRPEWLLPFLPSNPLGRVLITSRATVFDQVGITQPLVLDVLSPIEACNLLFARTKYERSEENRIAAAAINQELDGLPLALEQASAFMVRKRIQLPIYLTTYRKRGLPQLEESPAQTGQYPSSVLRTWAMNVQAIAAEQPAALELFRFSAFLAPDEIPYHLLLAGAANLGERLADYLQQEDADEIMLALSRLLEPLSQYSLINWISEREVYSVHRLVQAVTRDELDLSEQTTRISQVIEAVAQAHPGFDFKQWPQCTQLLPHWLQVFEQAQRVSIESEALGAMLNQAGFFLHDQGRYSEAEPLYQEALALRQRLLGNDHPDVATSLNNLAGLYGAQGRYSEAEPLYQEALALRQRLLGNDHPYVATSLFNLGSLRYGQGQFANAKSLLLEALKIYQVSLGLDHPTTKNLQNWLAATQVKLDASGAPPE